MLMMLSFFLLDVGDDDNDDCDCDFFMEEDDMIYDLSPSPILLRRIFLSRPVPM